MEKEGAFLLPWPDVLDAPSHVSQPPQPQPMHLLQVTHPTGPSMGAQWLRLGLTLGGLD